MMAKPMKSLELHYPMIQFLISKNIQWRLLVLEIKLISFEYRNAIGFAITTLLDWLTKKTIITLNTNFHLALVPGLQSASQLHFNLRLAR